MDNQRNVKNAINPVDNVNGKKLKFLLFIKKKFKNYENLFSYIYFIKKN